MNPIIIDKGKCTGCKKCLEVCIYNALEIIDKKAVVNIEKCTLCRLCMNVCKFNAISFFNIDQGKEITSYKGIWVIIEYFNNNIKNSFFQVISKANELSEITKEEITVIIIGKGLKQISNNFKKIFSEYGVKNIKLIDCINIINFFPEDIARIIFDEIILYKPSIVLFLGTNFGRSLAPRVASKVRTGITADCTELKISDDNNLIQIRPTYGGRIIASIICPFYRPQMASVRPNIFEIKKNRISMDKINLEYKEVEIDSIEKIKRVISTLKKDSKDISIDEADIIFCGGLGLGSKDGFKMLEYLANKVNAAVGATRAAVDKGWADASKLIGQTGKIIRPKIYFGFGVSGAIHHLIGMKNSKKIIAINKDPRAPILKIANIAIIGDVHDILCRLNNEL